MQVFNRAPRTRTRKRDLLRQEAEIANRSPAGSRCHTFQQAAYAKGLHVDVVIANQGEVARLLDMSECMAAMRDVLAGLTRGECQLPLRQILWLPDRVGALGMMPSCWSKVDLIGLKAVSFFPGNEGTELDTHQGVVLLYDAKRGRLVAIIDGTAITAIRTAAVSGVATELLAREDAHTLALIGSGVQAHQHLKAMLIARPIQSVRVASKSMARAQAFVKKESTRHSLDFIAVATVREAVDGADIVCTVTSSSQPVLSGDWISPGTHINAVGSSVSVARELDAEAVRRSRLFVDRMESALNEAGDFLLAKEEGVVGDDHILGELGALIAGNVVGRRADDDITLFKSVGLAVEDLAAARVVYTKAKETGSCLQMPLGGKRDATD